MYHENNFVVDDIFLYKIGEKTIKFNEWFHSLQHQQQKVDHVLYNYFLIKKECLQHIFEEDSMKSKHVKHICKYFSRSLPPPSLSLSKRSN